MALALFVQASFVEAAQTDVAVFPRPAHVVVVIEENKSFDDIIGNRDAPYINQLAAEGAVMARSYAITHPSLPNYLAIFSGSTYGVKDDGCDYSFKGPNLAQGLKNAGLVFSAFSESMPAAGFTQCAYNAYRKKHNALAYFASLPKEFNRPFRDFPRDFSHLPTVAFVIPNLNNDMHDGTIAQADAWLRKNISAYAKWAQINNSLLVLTWDEDDNSGQNHIVTILVGAHIQPGRYMQHIDHYDLLRTLTMFYGIAAMNKAVQAKPITGVWGTDVSHPKT